MADRQKQQIRRAVGTIKDGIEHELNKSPKLGNPAFTVSSQDIGITDPRLRMETEVSKRQVAKAGLVLVHTAADYYLNPHKYTLKRFKKEADRRAFKAAVDKGTELLNEQLPPGFSIGIDYGRLGFEDAIVDKRLPAVEARYKKPIELGGLKGTAGVMGRIDPRTKEKSLHFGFTGRFAKGGKVKKYAKGGGVRKPKKR